MTDEEALVAALTGGGIDVEVTDSHLVEDGFWSVFVRARKPQER